MSSANGTGLQAVGGNTHDKRAVHVADGKILAYLKHLFETHAGPDGKWSASQVKVFVHSVQQQQQQQQQQHDPSASSATASLLARPDLDLDGFLAYMTSPDGSIILPPQGQDFSWPLASYYISSSHNTYLSGNQLSSASTTDAYTSVLLKGCRCVEIDVWDGDESDLDTSSSESSSDDDEPRKAALQKETSARGERKLKKKRSAWDAFEKLKSKLPDSMSGSGKKNEDVAGFEKLSLSNTPTTDGSAAVAGAGAGASAVPGARSAVEPRVLHGHTLTKDVSFRDVCIAIRVSAFTVTDLPLIVSLEVHCSMEQQAVMVDIMKETWSGLLVETSEADILELPSPDQLRKKILVKVKYSPPTTSGSEKVQSSEAVEQQQPQQQQPLPADGEKPQKPSKINPALGQLGVYIKGVSFKTWSQAEASLPTHIFSLSETKFLSHHENQWLELFAHNKSFLLRAYPSGIRIGSSNLKPLVFWGGGAQVVALNWQEMDVGMMLNEGMFAGTGGYVLKPEEYRPNLASKSLPNTITRKTLTLGLTFLAARCIPLPPGDTSAKGFKPYVKVELHVDASETSHGEVDDEQQHVRSSGYKVHTDSHRGCDPDLKAEKLEFRDVAGLVEELTFVTFTVMDHEFGKDDMAAWACVRLDRLGNGYRFIRLLDTKGAMTDGAILVRIEKSLVETAPPIV